jgi:hypothetical protein
MALASLSSADAPPISIFPVNRQARLGGVVPPKITFEVATCNAVSLKHLPETTSHIFRVPSELT